MSFSKPVSLIFFLCLLHTQVPGFTGDVPPPTIKGPTNPAAGELVTYYHEGMHVEGAAWTVPPDRGYVVETWEVGDIYYANIIWSSLGLSQIKFYEYGDVQLTVLSVNVADALPPPVPSTTFSFDYRCGSTLITAGSISTSGDLYWQSSPNGTSTGDTGSESLMVTPGERFLRARSKYPPYPWSNGAQAVGYVTVNPVPSLPPATVPASRCNTGTLILGGTPGANGNDLRWYESYSDETANGTGINFQTPSIAVTTIYYVCTVNTSTGCESGRVPVQATVLSPAAPWVVGDDACPGQSVELDALPVNGGQDVLWYEAPSGGSPVGSGEIFHTPPLYASKTYYAASINYIDIVCESATRSPVTAVINPTPALPIVSDAGRCGEGVVILTGSPGTNGNALRWYTTPSGESPGAGLSYSTEHLSQSTTYYVSSYNTNTLCEGSRMPVTAVINPFPAAPTVSGNVRMGSGAFLLSASGPQGAVNYNWYTPDFPQPQTGSSYTTPVISSNQSNYLSVKAVSAANCEGSAAWVSLSIYPVPTITASSEYVSLNSNVTLNAGPGYDSYVWKNGDGGVVGNSQTLATHTPSIYTVTVTKNGVAGSGTSSGYHVKTQLDGLDHNYIITNTIQKEGIKDANAIGELSVAFNNQTITYFDGLGRSVQTVTTQGSPTGKDIVTHQEYDDLGREAKKYLPYTSTETTGRLKTDAVQKINPFYNDPLSKIAVDSQPYAQTIFERSPLSRIIKQGAPGATWQPDAVHNYSSSDHTIKKFYSTNAADEVLEWIYAEPTLNDSLGTVDAPQHFAANTLYKNLTKDEHQNEVIEYVDLEGKVILKRVQATGSQSISDAHYASTYYIYDDFNNLVCVIPPEAVKRITEEGAYLGKSPEEKTKFLQQWAFRYRYDGRKRMTIKQVPGAKYVYMLYDDRDRLVMTQDGRQRALETDEWTFTKYDALNRPVLTGTYFDTSSPSLLQASINTFYLSIENGEAWFESYIGSGTGHVMGYDNKSFPQVDDASKYLTATYYDIYDNFIAPPATQDNDGYAIANQDLPGGTANYLNKVIGKVTATQVKNLTTGAWMRSVNYYDDKYRVIQTITDHHKGTVRTSNVYDFIGKLIHTQRKYLVDGASTIVKESFTYDHAGRQLTASHSINGATPVVLSSNEYNELGQLVTRNLHRTQIGSYVTPDPAVGQPGVVYGTNIDLPYYNSAQHTQIATNRIRLQRGFHVPATNTFKARIGFSQQDADAHNRTVQENFLQVVDYRYNIRGWLTRINDPAALQSDDLFNMELRYSDPSGTGGTPQYNGNISEAVWKSAGQDRQSYGYFYDHMNRITDARYFHAAKPELYNGRYDEKIGDAESNPPRASYDLNGNILNLLRSGKTADGIYDLMDDLHYDYTNSGNRLVYVSDARPTNAQEEGFKEGLAGEASLDYRYDANGNMTRDENKGITNIEYNYLNLPSKISKGNDHIIYTYDATGRKLSQQVSGATAKTTDYIGELVCEDNTLLFANHSEGRVVKHATASDPWEYQYFMKDHLGNTRVVFGEGKNTTEYKATMEYNTQANETAVFQNYNAGARSAMPLFDHTDAGTTYTYSQLLNGGSGSQVGLAKSFEVNPGDVFDIEVYAKYEETGSTPNNVDALLSHLVSAFSLGAGTTPLDGSLAQGKFTELFPAGPWITSSKWDEAAPKAYLNYILFDENFAFQDFGFDQVSTAGVQSGSTPSLHDYLSLHVKVKKKGFLYVYLSNEQSIATNVYFDDMKIVRYTAIEQVNDYYPFGLTFNSYQRENSVDMDYLYNGKEIQNELRLGWLDYGARMYMPDIGRWGVIDPLADLFFSTSPYAYALNNPSTFNDIEGLLPGDPKYTGSGNVVIILSDNPKQVWNTSTLDNTAWDYGVFGSMSDAAAWLDKTYKKDGVAVQSLVIRTHGYVPLDKEGNGEIVSPGGDGLPNYISHEELDAGLDSDVVALGKIGKSLGENAEVLFTACNACMNTDKLPEAIFRVLRGKSKNLTLFTNGATTSLTSRNKVKVRKTLNANIHKLYAPWKETNSYGTTSKGRYVTPGLNTNGAFMWFYTPPTGGSSVVNQNRRMASPYHKHKFHGKE